MAEWVTFKKPVLFDRRVIHGICIEGPKGAAMAKEMGEIVSISSLPYPADPRLKTDEDGCPSFCFSPESCKGHHSCPRSYACSE